MEQDEKMGKLIVYKSGEKGFYGLAGVMFVFFGIVIGALLVYWYIGVNYAVNLVNTIVVFLIGFTPCAGLGLILNILYEMSLAMDIICHNLIAIGKSKEHGKEYYDDFGED